MSVTPRLKAQVLNEGQASAEVVLNTTQRKLEAMLSAGILDDALAGPPGSPVDGDAYIVAASPTGAWAVDAGVHAGDLTWLANGSWYFGTPKGGMTVFNKAKKAWYGYSSQESAWHPLQELWSTTEYWTGRYVGANKVYAKVLAAVTMPNAAIATTAHGITGLQLAKPVQIRGTATNGTIAFPFPQFVSFLAQGIDAWLDATNLNLASTSDQTVFTADVLLIYCR